MELLKEYIKNQIIETPVIKFDLTEYYRQEIYPKVGQRDLFLDKKPVGDLMVMRNGYALRENYDYIYDGLLNAIVLHHGSLGGDRVSMGYRINKPADNVVLKLNGQEIGRMQSISYDRRERLQTIGSGVMLPWS